MGPPKPSVWWLVLLQRTGREGKGCPSVCPVVCVQCGRLSDPVDRLCAVLDMQQTYDMWLKKHNPGKPGEGTPLTSREGEKQIQMPTDYADIMVISSSLAFYPSSSVLTACPSPVLQV